MQPGIGNINGKPHYLLILPVVEYFKIAAFLSNLLGLSFQTMAAVSLKINYILFMHCFKRFDFVHTRFSVPAVQKDLFTLEILGLL